MKTGTKELVFLVRMWAQAGTGSDEREWRGSIQEVASGVRLYVTGTRDVADFITARIAQRSDDRIADREPQPHGPFESGPPQPYGSLESDSYDEPL